VVKHCDKLHTRCARYFQRRSSSRRRCSRCLRTETSSNIQTTPCWHSRPPTSSRFRQIHTQSSTNFFERTDCRLFATIVWETYASPRTPATRLRVEVATAAVATVEVATVEVAMAVVAMVEEAMAVVATVEVATAVEATVEAARAVVEAAAATMAARATQRRARVHGVKTPRRSAAVVAAPPGRARSSLRRSRPHRRSGCEFPRSGYHRECRRMQRLPPPRLGTFRL